MGSRLTPFSKLLITLLIVAVVVLAGRWVLNNTDFGKGLKNKAETAQNDENSNNSDNGEASSDAIKIGVVTWGGYAGGQYFNEGFKANTNSRFYKDYGFKVDFKVLDDFVASRDAFKRGDIDLLWATIDAFPTEAGEMADIQPQVVLQADWSRGGDAIVVRRGIGSVADLKGKKIAVAELTPSHSFLLWLLEAGGMTEKDVTLIKQASAIDAAEAFKAQQVDAAVVWSPDDEACLSAVAGSRVLESSKSASNIIADVFIAKKAWIDANPKRLQQLYEGWMKGAAEINSDPAAKQKAAKILSENFEGISEEWAVKAIDNVRLCTHGDNLNFFGQNPDFKGVTGDKLYGRMSQVYTDLGYIKGRTPTWREIANSNAVRATDLAGSTNAAEGQKTFAEVTKKEGAEKETIATKRVSINFRSGEYRLDENAKYIIDKEFVEIAKAFANARIRIEGNTDDVGAKAANVALSQKRAEAVRDYLVSEHSMPRNRFIVIGNGPDNPVAPNTSEDGKAKNRRTDFELVRE
ncbi:MAG: OmpA family protein [Saprospiraceae bacterium]|nr:OmpA family protein [Saprospiraceae bacterium]MCF8250615.1 OmpA family protein [Saprospiraceae bacterium]MCF8282390.1 OmpA family protein [Bacteroidales bacterium]MCF8312246.1 OmpA family protein [Saprospiraceae bacterium]MCF8442803.1 OmpA family protein [Saprospiraceae bacterium]